MHGSKRDVADLLHEEAEVRSVRESLHKITAVRATQRRAAEASTLRTGI